MANLGSRPPFIRSVPQQEIGLGLYGRYRREEMKETEEKRNSQEQS